MKAGWKLFAGLAVFYFIVGIIYWLVGGEAVGMTAIPLSGALAALVGYYLWFTNRRLGIQPEDKLDGEIEENAGEIGFYSPHSWWPRFPAARLPTSRPPSRRAWRTARECCHSPRASSPARGGCCRMCGAMPFPGERRSPCCRARTTPRRSRSASPPQLMLTRFMSP